MKLTKKQLIIIAAALAAVIIAVVAIGAIADGKDEDKGANAKSTVRDTTTATYVRNAINGETEIEATAVRTGDFYSVEWTERDNVVRGTYDEVAGTMENWGNELPLCDAGLVGATDYVEGHEWLHWRDDNYTYDWEYYCEFNRADKTYVRSTWMDTNWYGFYYHETDGCQYVTELMGMPTNADGGIYCFKDGLCYGYEASLYHYERRVQDGKNMLVLLDTDGDIIDDEICMEDRGDTLYFALTNLSIKKANDNCYILESDEGPVYILLIDDHQLILGGGRSMGVEEDVELHYETGKRLEIVFQGQTLGCRVEGDVLIASVNGFDGHKEYCLVRQGVDPETVNPDLLFLAPSKCEMCEARNEALQQVESDEGKLWMCSGCAAWYAPDEDD